MCCLSLATHVCPPTCGAALVDDSAQSLAHCESQVWPFINSHTERAGDAFEGCQQVHGTCTEARKHGPNLEKKEEQKKSTDTYILITH